MLSLSLEEPAVEWLGDCRRMFHLEKVTDCLTKWLHHVAFPPAVNEKSSGSTFSLTLMFRFLDPTSTWSWRGVSTEQFLPSSWVSCSVSDFRFCKFSPLRLPLSSFRCRSQVRLLPVLWSTGYRLWASTASSMGLINLLEWLPEFRIQILLTRLCVL